MELLEREQCLVELTGWLDAAAERGGCVALVAGEAGIGKTALSPRCTTSRGRRKARC
jgi:predicted ATPase